MLQKIEVERSEELEEDKRRKMFSLINSLLFSTSTNVSVRDDVFFARDVLLDLMSSSIVEVT